MRGQLRSTLLHRSHAALHLNRQLAWAQDRMRKQERSQQRPGSVVLIAMVAGICALWTAQCKCTSAKSSVLAVLQHHATLTGCFSRGQVFCKAYEHAAPAQAFVHAILTTNTTCIEQLWLAESSSTKRITCRMQRIAPATVTCHQRFQNVYR